jgi:predicted N-formylglutamate amidohydrolase
MIRRTRRRDFKRKVMMGASLLAGEDECAAVVNERGASPVFLVCEHAGRRIPKCLGTLGLSDEERGRHIAWDIGAEGVARRLSADLDAPLVLQRYSRLVYDCNRPPESPTAIPAVSEDTRIPGNEALSAADREARVDAIYRPFHERVAELLDRRERRIEPTIFVTIHSFTPVFKGVRRHLDVGLLFDHDRRFTDALVPLLRPGADVRTNEPYGPEDGVCHTLHLHAEARGLPYAMIEIRNDLIAHDAGQDEWAHRLTNVLQQAAASFERGTRKAALHA